MAIDRNQILNDVLSSISKELGPQENIARYKDLNNMYVETLSSGSLGVDIILNGGFPKGRINQIVGKASSGKSTMALSMIAALQRDKPDAVIVYIDAEQAVDPKYARQLGVQLDDIVFYQPSSGDDGYNAAYKLIQSGIVDLLIIDSIPAMIPKASMDYEVGETQKVGLGATLDNQGVSRLVPAAKATGATVILINQYREKVTIGMPTQGDGFSGNGYLPGGQSLPFMSSTVLKIQRVGKEFAGDEVTGDNVRAWAIKHKTGRPYGTTDYQLDYGAGISLAAEIITWGVKFDLIGKTARTFWVIDKDSEDGVLEGSRQGSHVKFKEYLESQPELMLELRDKILKEALDADEIYDDEEKKQNEEKFAEVQAEVESMNGK